MNEDKNKQLFLSLVYSFQMQAMIQMGKLQNPVTGEIDRDLDAAQVSIDMIDMLKEKSKNNISHEESSYLTKVVSELKMNFVEEKQKPEPATDTDKGNESSSDNTGNNNRDESEDNELSERNGTKQKNEADTINPRANSEKSSDE